MQDEGGATHPVPWAGYTDQHRGGAKEQKRAGEKGLLAGKTEIWLLSFAGGRQFVSKG